MTTEEFGFAGNVPDRIIVGGIREWTAEKFTSIIGALLAEGATITPAPDLAVTSETKPPDTEIYLVDFARVSREVGFNKGVDHRTWNHLNRPWNSYIKAQQQVAEAGDVASPLQRERIDIPQWQKDIVIEQGVISYNGLRAAFESNRVIDITNIGRVCVALISKVLIDIERRAPQADTTGQA